MNPGVPETAAYPFEFKRVEPTGGSSEAPPQFRNRKFRLGRTRLDALTRVELLDLFAGAIKSRDSITVLHHNLHGVYVQHTTRSLGAIYDRADWVYVDGLPLIWLAKAAGLPFESTHRITLLDCFEEVVGEAARQGWRVFYYGGKEEVLTAGLTKLRALFPSLEVAGCNGYASAAQGTNVVDEISAFKPDILFVGLGMPLQEEWIARNRALLDVPVITTCGATMEYIAGYAYRPPAWAGKLGLYGVARLLSDPQRLWKRYLLEPLVLAPSVIRAILQRRFGRSS